MEPKALRKLAESTNINDTAALFLHEAAAEIERLEQDIQELTRKGEALCVQNGTLMIEDHDLKKRVAKLELTIQILLAKESEA